MVIGLDFDDVLMDFHDAFYGYHNPRFGTNLRIEDTDTYYVEELIGCSKEEFEGRIVDFYQSDDHTNAKIIPGADKIVRELSKNHELIIITSRPEFIKERTMRWLEQNIGDSIKHVHFTNLFRGEGMTKKSKVQVCQEAGVDVFVDDHFGYAKEVAQSGRKVLLFNTPWNQGALHPNVTRVNSWDHILEILQ